MTPLTKKRGVLGTPLRAPLRKSASTRAARVASGEMTLEALEVQVDGLGMTAQGAVAELQLVLEETIVHLPEPLLRAGRLGGSRRGWSAGVQVGERHVPEHEPEPVTEALQQLLDDRVGLAAIGALEVAVLNQGDRGVGRAADVIAVGVDGRAEGGDGLFHQLSLLSVS